MTKWWWTAALLGMLAGCGERSARDPTASSPDERMSISAAVDTHGALRVRVRRDGADILLPSPVGLSLVGEPAAPMAITATENRPASAAPDRRTPPYTEVLVRTRETRGAHRRVDLYLRAYDAGAAFRLVLPPQPHLATVRIAAENTTLRFAQDYSCLGVRQTKFVNSHEGDYAPVRASAIAPGDLYDLPLTCATGRGGETFAITESGIESFAAAYLTGAGGKPGVAIKLAPHPDDASLAVETPMTGAGVATPWRAVLVADLPERLIENTLVADLASPSRIGDAGWIRPGKSAWGWWSGLSAPGVADAGHNNATYRRYIDFAARFGLPYYLIDRGWAYRPAGPDSPADVMRSADRVHMAELVRYARKRHVRLWLWINWKALDGRMDEILALYERLGIAGVKADYIYRQDQAAVAFYHRFLAAAARHHLLVDLHASFVPRGLDRTYPNFLTEEGVMGIEYNKWSRKVTAGYDVRLAFTRAVIGPMDYAPGGFRNVTPAAFSPRHDRPLVMTTRAHQLAQFVVYPGPLTVLADGPEAYVGDDGALVPGAAFVRRVPTVWDETRGAAGNWASWVAIARRHGRQWYVGVLNNEQGRTVSVPLSFLAQGRWRLEAWTDGGKPDEIAGRRGTVDARTRLGIRLNPSGGAAIILSPL